MPMPMPWARKNMASTPGCGEGPDEGLAQVVPLGIVRVRDRRLHAVDLPHVIARQLAGLDVLHDLGTGILLAGLCILEPCVPAGVRLLRDDNLGACFASHCDTPFL